MCILKKNKSVFGMNLVAPDSSVKISRKIKGSWLIGRNIHKKHIICSTYPGLAGKVDALIISIIYRSTGVFEVKLAFIRIKTILRKLMSQRPATGKPAVFRRKEINLKIARSLINPIIKAHSAHCFKTKSLSFQHFTLANKTSDFF